MLILFFPTLLYAIDFAPYISPTFTNGNAKIWYSDGEYSITTTLPTAIDFNGVQVKVIQSTVGGVVQDEQYLQQDTTGYYSYGVKVYNSYIDVLGFMNVTVTYSPPPLIFPNNFNIGDVFTSSNYGQMEGCDAENTSDCTTFYLVQNRSITFLGFESVTVPIGTFNALKIQITSKTDILTDDETTPDIIYYMKTFRELTDDETPPESIYYMRTFKELTDDETTTEIAYYVANIGAVKTTDLYGNSLSVLTGANFTIPTNTVPVVTNSSYVDLHFDPAFYLNNNSDLIAAGYTVDNVEDHWLNCGIYEGRQGSSIFDVKYYLQIYFDLYIAYGSDYYGAYKHWLINGIQEGRKGSAMFDVQYYLQTYSDLQQAFGNYYGAAMLHWLNNGSQEGRKGVP